MNVSYSLRNIPNSLNAAISNALNLSACLPSFLHYTDSSLFFLLFLCICSSGELLHPVQKANPDKYLTSLDLVLALTRAE